MDELVMRADSRFQELSDQNESGFKALDDKMMQDIHKTFIEKVRPYKKRGLAKKK
jgi:hypothetical protein